jgi:hypothetical protein
MSAWNTLSFFSICFRIIAVFDDESRPPIAKIPSEV